MTRLIRSYLQVLEGHFGRATFLIGLSTLAGILEGIALVCLMPILNVGLSSAAPQISSLEIFHWAWEGTDRHRIQILSLALFFILGVLSAVTKATADLGALRLRTTIELDCRRRLTDALLSMRWTDYATLNTGEIAKASAQEAWMIGMGVAFAILLCGQVLVSCWLIVLAFGLSPKMTLITLAFGALSALVFMKISAATKRHAAAYTESSSSLANTSDRFFANFKFIKSSGLSKYAQSQLSLDQEACATHFFRTYAFQPLGQAVFEILGILFIGSCVAFTFLFVPSAIGRIVVFLAVFYRLAPRLMGLHQSYNQALSIEPWNSNWRQRYAFAVQHKDAALGGVRTDTLKQIQFDHVSFSYENRSILRDIHFELPAGKMIALVGESGGGKTTILDIITGLIRPTEGACLINGVPLFQIALEDWRQRIGIVQQNPPIFHTSVLNNIAGLDPHPDRPRAEEFARMAHAWEFIEPLTDRLDFQLGDKGTGLSQGECQRLALARALYRKPWLLVLDEVTSALDAVSESQISETLRRLKGTVTMILVAHRLNTVEMADEILVVSGGQIVERGRYAELMSRSASEFRRLAKLQAAPGEQI